MIIDLDKPSGDYEVAVFHFADGGYSVDANRGFGSATVYVSTSRDKAVGVAEYLESQGRYRYTDDGEAIENGGEPYDGSIWHWSCGCTKEQCARRETGEAGR